VLLHRRDYHAMWVNRRALERAGLGDGTPDPEGGRLGRDAAGRLTGVALEHAVRPLQAIVPAGSEARDARLLRAAIARLHAEGITSVHDFEGEDEVARIRPVICGPEAVPLRVLAHVAHAALDATLAAGVASGAGDDRFRTGGLKLFADGTLGSRTAALLEPYDGGTDLGLDLMPPEELRATVARAITGGLSVAVHAIGDRAVRNVLDAFEAVTGEARARLALAPRIEHAQLVHPDDVARFAALGVAASMQPSHGVSDIPLARERWSRRLDRAYPWRTLLEAGASLAFGSDAPVEPPSAALGLAAAVSRRAPGAPDAESLSPAQRLSLDEALRAYTSGPARLDGRWPRGGSLRAGAHGDVVVWDRDLFAATPDALAAARPAATLLDGRTVHLAANADRAEVTR
jgi:predicted amidohydrolase YtcJ